MLRLRRRLSIAETFGRRVNGVSFRRVNCSEGAVIGPAGAVAGEGHRLVFRREPRPPPQARGSPYQHTPEA